VNSIFQFQLERGGDGTKRYRKMKRMQRAYLDSMGRKRDTIRRHDDVNWRSGRIEQGKERRRRQLE
jgi:hypothetical protein